MFDRGRVTGLLIFAHKDICYNPVIHTTNLEPSCCSALICPIIVPLGMPSRCCSFVKPLKVAFNACDIISLLLGVNSGTSAHSISESRKREQADKQSKRKDQEESTGVGRNGPDAKFPSALQFECQSMSHFKCTYM